MVEHKSGAPNIVARSPTTLDPEDWDAFRAIAHKLLDSCVDRMQNARDFPWIPLPDGQIERYKLIGQGQGHANTAERLLNEVMPYATGNTHPTFFGWVHGTGLPVGLLSEMVSATMNSNGGGRDHGMNYIERAVIDWTRQVMGFPENASGVLVTGTSQATVIALTVARQRALSDVRANGLAGAQLAVYAGSGVHSASVKALEVLGLGNNMLRLISTDEDGIDIDELRNRISEDRANGLLPMAIVGTAGSVDLGRFDNLNALADFAKEQDIWLHIDGAFGAWTRLADEPWRSLSNGIDRADSLACDFHKWMYVPYDCGLALIRNESEHRAAFAARPAYLSGQSRGLGGGEPWFCDYGIDLSRGSRALRVWAAIEAYGAERLGGAITSNCEAALHMASQIQSDEKMALAGPIVSNICAFTADAQLSFEEQSAINSWIAETLQLTGKAVFSTTVINGVTVLRAAITNHRTSNHDIVKSIHAVVAARDGWKLSRSAKEMDQQVGRIL